MAIRAHNTGGLVGGRHGQPARGCARSFTRGAAFTLIELLVVLAVIAVLSSLLLPVFSKARHRSKNAACVSNLRQLGVALMGYAEDYDERMPVGLDMWWADIEQPPIPGARYLNKVMAGRTTPDLWQCPADQGFLWWNSDFSRAIVDYTPSCFQTRGQSYDYNLLMAWDYARRRVSPIPVSRVKKPASVALLKDAHFSWHNNNSVRNPLRRDKQQSPAWNVLYVDGHVKSTTVDWYRSYTVSMPHYWYRDNNPRL